MDELLDLVTRHVVARVGPSGSAALPVAELTILRETSPSPLRHAVSKPLVALVLQGRKNVAMGGRSLDLVPGDTLLVTTDVPTVSQVTQASRSEPYLSLVLEIEARTVAELVAHAPPASVAAGDRLRSHPSDGELTEVAVRTMRLVDRPPALAALGPQLAREMHYWLLAGRHGGAIRALGTTDAHAARIGRAVQLLRARFAEPVRMETLAEVAGMGMSSFHSHFREMTSLTPLQFQKQLRLIEARRRMLVEGEQPSHAAYSVGYESVPQFTREYARMFGRPPARDVRHARSLEVA